MKLTDYDENKVDLPLAKQLLREGLYENPHPSDLLFVFGCPSAKHRTVRIQKAVALYQQGYSSKILFSGGNLKGIDEAEAMKQEAIALGVQEKDILVETISLNTTENILASLYVIEKHLHLSNIHTITFISTEAHLKRCLLTAKKYLPAFIHFDGGKANLPLEEETEQALIQEAQKLILYAKKGFIAEEL